MQEEKQAFSKARLAFNIIKYTLFAFVVIVMIFILISSFNFNNANGGFIGYKLFVVASDSMNDTFKAGDVIAVKEPNVSQLGEGDIITFRSIDPDKYNEIITHKIRESTTHEGKSAFVTYGTTTGSDDAYPAIVDKIIGEYSFRLPKAGYLFNFIKSPIGYFTMIFCPFFLLIVMEGMRFFKLTRSYKEAQKQELARQRSEVEDEKRKIMQMMEELQRMKDQMVEPAQSPEASQETDQNGGDA